MAERSIYLYCTEGGSDKEYHLHLRARDGAWALDYANGKRGAVGRSTQKLAPTTLDAANKEFDKIVKSKMKGGYTEAESGVRFTDTVHAQSASGHAQQLPTAVDEHAAKKLVLHHGFALQEKANGERRSSEVIARVARGINKLGLYVNLPENIAQDMSAFGDAFFDGEQVGMNYYVFDLLQIGNQDLRGRPFGERYAMLEDVLKKTFRTPSSCIHLLKAEFTPMHKQAMLDRIAAANGEGGVFKDVTQPYEGGRSPNVFKYKFTESSTCQVLDINKQRSVQIGLLNANGRMLSLGNVTIPANFQVPARGDLVEVEYLYFTGSAFEQPVYLGPRNDILPEECTLAQITRLKPGMEMDEQGSRRFERERG
jgi:bifunctional non-homologous end joining protein LigD